MSCFSVLRKCRQAQIHPSLVWRQGVVRLALLLLVLGHRGKTRDSLVCFLPRWLQTRASRIGLQCRVMPLVVRPDWIRFKGLLPLEDFGARKKNTYLSCILWMIESYYFGFLPYLFLLNNQFFYLS